MYFIRWPSVFSRKCSTFLPSNGAHGWTIQTAQQMLLFCLNSTILRSPTFTVYLKLTSPPYILDSILFTLCWVWRHSVLILTLNFIKFSDTQNNSLAHTASALSMAFDEMLKTWNIPKSKVHAIQRDDAPNMSKAMKDAHLPSLPGKAPKLQLAIDEGMFSQCSRSDIVAIGRTAATLNILLSHTSECAHTTGLVKEKATARWPPDGTAHILCLMEQKHVLGQGWAINFPKGPHEIVGLLWRAGP